MMIINDGVPFAKLSGAGNDFIVINLLEKDLREPIDRLLKTLERSTGHESNLRSQLAQRLCRRDVSIGADGAIFLEASKIPGADFRWDFYNSDGSAAEMCGNAARCVARFAFESTIAGDHVLFETVAGVVEAEKKSDTKIMVSFRFPHLLQAHVILKGLSNEDVLGTWIDSGVPHFVIHENVARSLTERRALAKHLRKSKELGARGANITYVSTGKQGQQDVITFERGVEDFTKACGTGAIAAAYSLQLQSDQKTTTLARMPGGNLSVDLDPANQLAHLTGDAHWIFSGVFTAEAIL